MALTDRCQSKSPHEVLHCSRRLDSEFVVEDLAKKAILASRLPWVALSEVGLDERSTTVLAFHS